MRFLQQCFLDKGAAEGGSCQTTAFSIAERLNPASDVSEQDLDG
jgi:hypothetical protein